MFVRDTSACDPVLAKGLVDDDHGVFAIVIESTYAISGGRIVRLPATPPRIAEDPPDIRRFPIWRGVSVTASGSVHGPARPPYARTATLEIGPRAETLAIFGERRWVHNRGQLVASEPARFDSLQVTFDGAFGGGYDVAPGLLNGLPHPGFRVVYPRNPRGMGFYESAAQAAGQPLPRVEIASEQVRTWHDRPEPGGFSVCPDLAALRLSATSPKEPPLFVGLRALQHAPGRLIRDEVPTGTSICLNGFAGDPIRFETPPSPARVDALRGKGAERIHFAVRSIHIDANARTVRIVHGHSVLYARRRPPTRIYVRPREV